jgi:hypothetical protein
MIDLVTIVFRDELDILRVQAESIELYCQGMGIQNIYVVVNDDDAIVNKIDPNWWGSLSSYVKIIPRSAFSTNFFEDGWLTQQLLKLLSSAISQNEYSIILDAKTIFIQDLKLNLIFDNQKRITWSYFSIMDVFTPAQKIVNKLFDIDLEFIAGPGGVPFIFHNATTRELINEVGRITNEDFTTWFQTQGMVTEFILYTGYVLYRDGTLDKVYTPTTECPYGPVNICHSEILLFDEKIKEMQSPFAVVVSIHRHAWTKLTKFQKQSFKDLLKNCGINRAMELV